MVSGATGEAGEEPGAEGCETGATGDEPGAEGCETGATGELLGAEGWLTGATGELPGADVCGTVAGPEGVFGTGTRVVEATTVQVSRLVEFWL